MTKLLRLYTPTLLLTLVACESTNGVPFGATAEGSISTRAVHPFPALSTFAVYAPEVLPSLETADVTACLARHLQSFGGRLVSLDERPQAVVIFQFDTDAAPSSYRRDAFNGSTFTARWTRHFSVRLLDGSAESAPSVLWHAEITSPGSSSTLGPVAFTFLDQAFQRFGRSVSGETFLVLANRTCAAAPQP